MYIKVPNFYLDLLENGKITAQEIGVLIFLLRHTLGYHQDSFKISLPELCKKLSLSKQTIINSLKSLEDKKIITIFKTEGYTNEYFINKELLKIK